MPGNGGRSQSENATFSGPAGAGSVWSLAATLADTHDLFVRCITSGATFVSTFRVRALEAMADTSPLTFSSQGRDWPRMHDWAKAKIIPDFEKKLC
jgi:hypothetical protein